MFVFMSACNDFLVANQHMVKQHAANVGHRYLYNLVLPITGPLPRLAL